MLDLRLSVNEVAPTSSTSNSIGPMPSRSPGESTASVNDWWLSRVSAAQQRTTVAAGRGGSGSAAGATPRARSRNVQCGPEPIVHLADFSRTIWPSREEPEMRRTKSPRGKCPAGRPFRCKRCGNHGLPPFWGDNALNPLLDLAYADGDGQNLRRGAEAVCERIGEKRLYIFAGFDDYRIATRDAVNVAFRPRQTGGGGIRFFRQSVPTIGTRNILRILTHMWSVCVVYFGC